MSDETGERDEEAEAAKEVERQAQSKAAAADERARKSYEAWQEAEKKRRK